MTAGLDRKVWPESCSFHFGLFLASGAAGVHVLAGLLLGIIAFRLDGGDTVGAAVLVNTVREEGMGSVLAAAVSSVSTAVAPQPVTIDVRTVSGSGCSRRHAHPAVGHGRGSSHQSRGMAGGFDETVGR